MMSSRLFMTNILSMAFVALVCIIDLIEMSRRPKGPLLYHGLRAFVCAAMVASLIYMEVWS